MPTSISRIHLHPRRIQVSAAEHLPGFKFGRNRWAIILAGGDGTRLLPLTRRIAGDDRPKQFCSLSGNGTLLDQTRHRVSQIIPDHNSLVLLTRAHERWYRDCAATIPPDNLLIQPSNCGTASAIAFGVSRLNVVAPDAVVGFFPSDHHFSDIEAFARCVDQAYAHAENLDKVVLLGIKADSPEQSYGWIEPGARLRRSAGGDLFAVRRFWEKPSAEITDRLMRARSLWNSFVMIGRVGAFLKIMRRTLPELVAAFDTMQRGADAIYGEIIPHNFSQDVLAACPSDLSVLAAENLGWTDLGEPERVRTALQVH